MKWKLPTAMIAFSGLFAYVSPALAQSTQPAVGAATEPSPVVSIDTSLPRPDVPLPPGMTPLFDGKTLNGWVQEPPDSRSLQPIVLAA
jgi:hypothetical protein